MIEEAISGTVTRTLSLNPESRLAESITFFIYDSIKILILLYVMIGVIGVFRTYISDRKIKDTIAKSGPFGYLLASLFGVITPFCSCSSIPIFMSFIKAGVPLGQSFSFLVTSPLINEYLVALMLGFFGLKITLAYVLVGIILGTTAGVIMTLLKMEKHVVEEFQGAQKNQTTYKKLSERVSYGKNEAGKIVRQLYKWVLFGVGVGALIHGYVPEEAIHSVLEKTGVLSVPLAVLTGIPIYANCSAVVPIAVVLFQKGVPLGTALAFMMATAALSLPEAVILRRVMKLPLILTFFTMVGAGIILIGYAFNIIY